MQITNTQPGPRGINTVNGPVLVEPNQTVEAEVYEREKAHIEAAGWFKTEGRFMPNPSASSGPATASEDTSEIDRMKVELAAKEAEIERLKSPASRGPEAKHRGAGSYSIMEGDAELREKLTKEQAEAFNALDAGGKAKWLDENPKSAA